MNDCRHASFTGRPWIGGYTNCTIVECRAPEAIEDATTGVWNRFGGRDGVRRAVDDRFKPIPNAKYLEIRSPFCGPKCPFFAPADGVPSPRTQTESREGRDPEPRGSR